VNFDVKTISAEVWLF